MSERENRYAEAIWPSENGKFRNPHLRELEDEQVLRVMAVADEERAADRAEIERLRLQNAEGVKMVQALTDELMNASQRTEDLVADLRALIAPTLVRDTLSTYVHAVNKVHVRARVLRDVIDKHAGSCAVCGGDPGDDPVGSDGVRVCGDCVHLDKHAGEQS